MESKNREIYSLEAEQSLLGALLIDPAVYAKISTKKIEAQDFYISQHGHIFTEIKILAEAGKPWDTVILHDQLQFKNKPCLSYLIDLFKNTPGTSNAEVYAEIVKERSVLRKLLKELNVANHVPLVKESQEILESCLRSINDLHETKAESFNTSYGEFKNYLISRRESEQLYQGISTCLPSLDHLTGGLCKGHFIVIAARPSVGKSALGLYLTGRALMQGQHVLFWSTEMSHNTILARMFSQFCHIPAYHLTHNPKALSEKDIETIESWRDSFETLYVESGHAHIRNVCNRAKSMGKLDLLVVDYLQNLKGEGENTLERLNHISNTLQNLSMELNIPVIALAQLNRQAQHIDIPSMAEIKGSGAIEQDADLVMLLHHNKEETEEKYWLLCEKNRHGEIKNIPLIFQKAYQTFSEDNSTGRFLTKKNYKGNL